MQYLRIKESIQKQIDSGELAAYSKLPNERALAESFGTTRVTLREALALLEADGKVYREDRRGWFVSPGPLLYDPTRTDNIKTMVSKAGRLPKTQLIVAKTMMADTRAIKLMNLDSSTPIFFLERLRWVDNRPVAVTMHRIRQEYFPDLLEHDLTESLTDVYREHYQCLYKQVHFQVRTTSIVGPTAQALRTSNGSPGTLVQRVNYDHQGRLLDCDLEYWRHDAITIKAVADIT